MTSLTLRRTAILSTTLAAIQSAAMATPVPFTTGRFVSEDRDVFNGLFSGDVLIDTLTLGDTTYRAELQEFVEAAAIRVYVDRTGNGSWELLTDEDLAGGAEPVSLALARDLNPADIPTALDAVQGLSISHMLHTTGSAAVRVDVLLTVGIYDDKPTEDDQTPEAIVVGSFRESGPQVTAMIAGHVDEPVFAGRTALLDGNEITAGATGMDILLGNNDTPQGICVLGLDLSGQLGVEEGILAVGYRLEIPAGQTAMFNIFGAAVEGQRALGEDLQVLDEPEAFGGALGGGGRSLGAGVGAGSHLPRGSRTSFRGSGGGGGGGGGGRPPFEPKDTPDDPEKPQDVPAPGSLITLLAGGLIRSRRQRRD